MPSAKPDMAAVRQLVKERGLWHLQDIDIMVPAQQQLESLMCAGGIDSAAARDVLAWLKGRPEIAAIFPHNALIMALESMCQNGGWGGEPERQLIQFIASAYADSMDDFSLKDLFSIANGVFHGMQRLILDVAPPAGLRLDGKLCAVTGGLADMTRRECYEFIRSRGGTPTEVEWSTDFLFVATAAIDACRLTGSLRDAIYQRQRRGRLRIYGEAELSRC